MWHSPCHSQLSLGVAAAAAGIVIYIIITDHAISLDNTSEPATGYPIIVSKIIIYNMMF